MTKIDSKWLNENILYLIPPDELSKIAKNINLTEDERAQFSNGLDMKTASFYPDRYLLLLEAMTNLKSAEGELFVEIITNHYKSLKNYDRKHEKDITSDVLKYATLVKPESQCYYDAFAQSGGSILLRRNSEEYNLVSFSEDGRNIIINFNNEPPPKIFKHELAHLIQKMEILARCEFQKEKIPIGSAKVLRETGDVLAYLKHEDEFEVYMDMYISGYINNGITKIINYYDEMIFAIFEDVILYGERDKNPIPLFPRLSDDEELKEKILEKFKKEGITYIELKP